MSEHDPTVEDRRAHERYRVRDYLPVEVAPAAIDESIGHSVFLHDVSAAGVGFTASADLGLGEGTALTLAYAGRRSPIRLRHVTPGDDGWVTCGATFVDVHPEILSVLEDALHGNPSLEPSPENRLDALAIHFQHRD